jgi:DNA-binding response OmpR family regulator
MSTILLVDGDADCRLIFRSAFSHDGYRVMEARDGDEAVRLLAEHDVRLVVGELYVAARAGELFVPALKSHPQAKALSVIIVSTQAFDDCRVEAFAGGADEFLVKPCELTTVRAVVRRLMGAAPAPQHSPSDLQDPPAAQLY